MIRASRAERKFLTRYVLICYFRKDRTGFLTVGQIARRLGLKSSTYLKKILFEMSSTDEEIVHAKWDGVDKWKFQPYEQTSFLDRIPVIKNKGIVQLPAHKSTLSQLLNMMITEV